MQTAGILGMGMPGTPEVLLIIFIILLLFGAKKLPELSRSLGKSLNEFRRGMKEVDKPDQDITPDPEDANDEDEEFKD